MQIPRLDLKKTIGIAVLCVVFLATALYRAYVRPAFVTAQAMEQSTTASFAEEHRLPLKLVSKE